MHHFGLWRECKILCLGISISCFGMSHGVASITYCVWYKHGNEHTTVCMSVTEGGEFGNLIKLVSQHHRWLKSGKHVSSWSSLLKCHQFGDPRQGPVYLYSNLLNYAIYSIYTAGNNLQSSLDIGAWPSHRCMTFTKLWPWSFRFL